MIISLNYEMACEKINSLHEKKSRGESRDKKYKPKHNKGNIKLANRQQRIKLRET